MGKQLKIVGTERKDINPELEKLAAKYVDKRDARMALQKEEADAKEALTLAMKAAKLQHYLCDEIEQEVFFEKETVTNVKVKKVAPPEPEDAEPEST